MFQSALRFAVVSDATWAKGWGFVVALVSIRFEVRGGFRPLATRLCCGYMVSIRFEVRGGFRRDNVKRNSVLRRVSIRFEVRGGFRLALPTCPKESFIHQSFNPL